MSETPEFVIGSGVKAPRWIPAASATQVSSEEVLSTALQAARALVAKQSPDGYWNGDLTADSTLQADYILLQMWLYPADAEGRWSPPTMPKIRKAARAILDAQNPDGGWSIYVPGPAEINATVRAYTALKMAGMDMANPRMRQALALAQKLGGIQACNSYTKINFSLFDLFPRKFCPSVPPELMILPGNFLYEMSSWTRSIIVPLSIVQALGGAKPTPGKFRVEELTHPKRKFALARRDRIANLFVAADKLFKRWERHNVRVIRQDAIREAENWMLQHLEHSEGLGAIYPGMMYAIMAMDALGYERDHPDFLREMRHFGNLMLERADSLIFQPAKSPVWDTAIAAYALGEFGETDSKVLRSAADWLLSKEIRRKGDWARKRPDLRPSGWAFEFDNEFYPDIDDTAMVLLALLHAKSGDREKQARVEKRAVDWLLGMQSSDGGWAAFDVDNDWQLLNKVPFADHNAMLDPTCPDITGRTLESLCARGFDHTAEPIARGIAYLLARQEEDGRWYGRWGVNYIYGTFLAIRGLKSTGALNVSGSVERAAEWLKSVQNLDGGWGESCLGYETGKFERTASTPSQTAWAILGLIAAGKIAAGKTRAVEVAQGVKWLGENQRPDGTWDEAITTGTGFPRVFYISYHLYRDYFPLLALTAYRKALASG